MSSDEMLPYVVGLGGLILAYLGWRRTDKGDTAETSRWMGRIDEKLDNIGKKLDKLDGLPERVCDLERRVDALEKKGE